MSKTNVTIMICLPKYIEDQFYEMCNPIFRKYGKKRLRSTKDGVYYQIPHITLLSLGDSIDQKDELVKRLEKINLNRKIIIKSEKLTLFENKEESHLVVKIKINKELAKLHKEIYHACSDLIKNKSDFVLDKYTPHITIISNVPTELGKKLLKEIQIQNFNFEVKTIGIKIKNSGDFAKMYKTFKICSA